MLNFDSSLSNALTTHATNAFWVLKLYYNDESSFYGVSDQDRTDGSDTYYGIVSSWGSLNQSLDFFNFTTSTGNMSVNLINTDNTIEGGRFSDLFSTYNFANRKWELFLNTDRAGTYDTSARMIGTGIISGDISYDTKSITLKLLDFSSKYHKQLPTNVVDSTYPNAPEKNVNKPIPMAYGDFHDKTGIGIIPPSGAEFDRHISKGNLPAIITEEWDSTNANFEAKVDSIAIHTLDKKNVRIFTDNKYSACEDTNVDVTGNPIITFKGTTYRYFQPLKKYNTYDSGNYANTIDEDFSTHYTLEVESSTHQGITGWRIPLIPKLGEVTSVRILLDFGTFSGTTPVRLYNTYNFQLTGNTDIQLTWNGGDQSADITAWYNTASKDAWKFNGTFLLEIDDFEGKVDDQTVEIKEIAVEIEFEPSQTFSKEITETVEVAIRGGLSTQNLNFQDRESFPEKVYVSRTQNLLTPSVSDYIYYSGKGRKYGAWISDGSRSVGYSTSDFIENPVFIIEDILRTELSLSDTEIAESTFDDSGNYDSGTPDNDGFVKDIYGEDKISDIKYAFSQYKFINSKDLINRLCKQMLSWVFISGDGKFKIKTLRRTEDYSSVDKTIDFNDISLKNISRTSLGAVRNDITINYNHDYGQNQFISNATAEDTGSNSSQSTDVEGVGQPLKLELDADTLDSTTATQLADAYMTIFKDRKIMLNFDCLRPAYNDLEIGDIVKFSNWDTTIKLYGDAMGTDYYIISSISKKPNGCSVKAIKVS